MYDSNVPVNNLSLKPSMDEARSKQIGLAPEEYNHSSRQACALGVKARTP